MRWAVLTLLCAGCVPPFIDVTGLRCDVDPDCGSGFMCFRGTCAKQGSVNELSLALEGAGDEGGVLFTAGVARRAPAVSRALGFTASGSALPAARAEAGVAFLGDLLVSVGGVVGTAASAEVLVARLDAQGALSAWAPGLGLPAPRRGACAVAAGGALYVVGGRDAAGRAAAEVWRAEPDASGALGGFAEVAKLPSGRAGHACAASGGYLWLVGGTSEAGVSAQVLAARVKGDGTLAAWGEAGLLPDGERTGHSAVAYGGRLYVSGGTCNQTVCASQLAALTLDGKAGGWRAFAALPSERTGAALAASGGALFLQGGRRGDGTVLPELLVSQLGLDGTPGAWRSLTPSPGRLSFHALAARNGRLYLVGGNDGAKLHAEVLVAATALGGTSAFSAGPALQQARNRTAVVALGSYVYAIGGHPGGTGQPASIVERAEVRADGALGPWSTAATLLMPLSETAPGAFNGFLYAAGGCNGQPYCPDTLREVELLPVRADGSLATPVLTTALPNLRDRTMAQAVVYRGRLYVTGGMRGYKGIPDVSVGQLDPTTGAVTAWRDTAPLPGLPGRMGHAVAAYNGVLYVLGGGPEQFNGYEDRVLMARIGPDGLLEGWTDTARFSGGRNTLAAVAHDDVLYVIGGCDEQGGASYCGHLFPEVQAAPILADGTLGAWSLAQNLVQERSYPGAAVLRGKVFVAGGYDGNPVGIAESATLLGHGQLEPWRAAPAMSAVREAHGLVSDGERLYVTGGAGATTSVEWAAVQPDGALGPWSAAPALPQPRSEHGSAVARGYLFVLGGADASGAPTASVYAAPVSAAGVGAWNVARELPQALRGLAAASDGERLYVAGGQDSAQVLSAAVGADGALGEWVVGAALPAPRVGHALIAHAGALYVVAGRAGAGSVADVLFSRVGADGAAGAWVRTAWLTGNREGVAAAAGGGYLYVLGGRPNDPKAERPAADFSAEVLVAPLHPDGTLGEFATSAPFANGRTRAAAAVAGGNLFVAGGLAASAQGDVQAARLLTPPPTGTLSMRVDLGRTVSALRSVRLSGAGARGRFAVVVRPESESGEAGELIRVTARAGEDAPLPPVAARSLWVQVTLDESADAVRSHDGTGARDLTGVDVSFTP